MVSTETDETRDLSIKSENNINSWLNNVVTKVGFFNGKQLLQGEVVGMKTTVPSSATLTHKNASVVRSCAAMLLSGSTSV